jgi:hypothetical protein
MSEITPDLEFVGDGSADSYHAFVGSSGTPHFRKLRADAWKEANPTRWKMTYPEGTPMDTMTTAERNAFKYKVEPPPAPVIVLVDSRPAHEGYPDTFNFDVCHPALRR